MALAVIWWPFVGLAVAAFVDTRLKRRRKAAHTGHEQPLVTSPTTEQPVDNPVSDVPYERPTTTTPTTAFQAAHNTGGYKPADLFMLPIGNGAEALQRRTVYSKPCRTGGPIANRLQREKRDESRRSPTGQSSKIRLEARSLGITW